jgi:soluble lytic murein transglycosylase-like protein
MQFSIRSTVSLLVLIPGLASACWEQAAKKHNVPAVLLQAIADTESGMNPAAVNKSHIRRTGTVDIGYMQVNSDPRVLRNLGVSKQDLFEPCANINAGARILSEKIARHGYTWEAIGAYNAASVTMTMEQCLRTRMRYAWRVYRSLTRRPAPSQPESARLVAVAPLYSVSLR